MLDPISSAAVLHSMLPVNVGLPVDADLALQAAAQPIPVPSVEMAGVKPLLIDAVTISRVTLHAESLIAARLGANGLQTKIAVNARRYDVY